MKASSFLLGVGVGAAVALLYAPRSGEETRDLLTGKVEDGKQYAKDRAQELADRVTDKVEKGRKVVAQKAKAAAAAAGAAADTYARESQPESTQAG